MKAELISVGTELLLGDILNTNARFLGRELAALGVGVYRQTTVGDNAARLKLAIQRAFEDVDLVILTGGLGPTEDDLTKETVFDCFGYVSVMHAESLARLKDFFEHRNRVMPENNLKQALFPVEAQVLRNDHGTAPGCVVGRDGKFAVVLPGPPREMVPMFESGVRPWLEARSDRTFVSRTVHFYGIGESAMELEVKDLIHQENPTVAPYAKTGECELRITASAGTASEASALIAPVEAEIVRRLGQYIYGYDSENLASALARELKARKLSLSLAESCTGGMIANRLVDIPGSSAFLKEGLVVYSNEAKMNRLGVKPATLERFGAVSEETVREMVAGCQKTSGTHAALAVTGIAGPDGGSAEKPVGTVWFGIAVGDKILTQHRVFNGDRQLVRERAASEALDFLRRNLD